MRILPWLALFVAAWAIGVVAPREWWVVPAIAVAGFAIALLFIRLGLHRMR